MVRPANLCQWVKWSPAPAPTGKGAEPLHQQGGWGAGPSTRGTSTQGGPLLCQAGSWQGPRGGDSGRRRDSAANDFLSFA